MLQGAEGIAMLAEVEMPEELEPLVEALQRSRLQMEEAIGIREALEAEVNPSRVTDCLAIERAKCVMP